MIVLQNSGERFAHPSHSPQRRHDPRADQPLLPANGKLERWHGSLKQECIRPGTPLCLEDARRLVERYVKHYNTVRLHSAIGYVAPADRLAGRQQQFHDERDRKLAAARERRRQRRAERRQEVLA